MNLLLEHSGFLFALGEARRITFTLEVDMIEFLQRQLGRRRFFKLEKAFPDGSVRHAHDLSGIVYALFFARLFRSKTYDA